MTKNCQQPQGTAGGPHSLMVASSPQLTGSQALNPLATGNEFWQQPG